MHLGRVAQACNELAVMSNNALNNTESSLAAGCCA
jgi:hypothetical protein